MLHRNARAIVSCHKCVSLGLLLVFMALAAEEAAPPKIDSKAILEALLAMPPAERNAVLNKLEQNLPGEVAIPERMKLAKDIEEPPPLEKKEDETKHEPEKWSLHFQATIVSLMHDTFKSPYESHPASLLKEEGNVVKTSVTDTFFFGRKLWEGGEAYFNPEMSGGEGFSGGYGIGGNPNGDTDRGQVPPSIYACRFFLRQTFNLGGEKQDVEGGANQLAGTHDEKRIVITAGKISLTDIFDNNKYSHDPRAQFMNWGMMDDDSFDYAADARGYTPGLAVEYFGKDWAVRYGAFAVVKIASGYEFDYNLDQALSHNFEIEKSYKLFKKEGTTRFLAYANNAFMGSYKEAVQEGLAAGTTPDITHARSYHTKYGFSISTDQQIFEDFGAFARVGWSDGQSESFMFTEVDSSASLGLSWMGTRWKRPDDVVALGGVINGISDPHRNYLQSGGIGGFVGDGNLSYSTEKIIEAYYKLAMTKNLFLTLDYQFVEAPGYNRARGPVNIGGLRFHTDF